MDEGQTDVATPGVLVHVFSSLAQRIKTRIFTQREEKRRRIGWVITTGMHALDEKKTKQGLQVEEDKEHFIALAFLALCCIFYRKPR